MIKNGKQVAIEYRVFSKDNKQIDSNVGKEPFIFLFGKCQILPALENALLGLKVGDSKQVILKPEEAYGTVNPEAFKKVDTKHIPEDLRFQGALLLVSDEQFGEMLIRVDAVEGDEVILDFNHPLAGQILKFDVNILDIS